MPRNNPTTMTMMAPNPPMPPTAIGMPPLPRLSSMFSLSRSPIHRMTHLARQQPPCTLNDQVGCGAWTSRIFRTGLPLPPKGGSRLFGSFSGCIGGSFSAESFEPQADPSTGARELNSACPEIVLLMPESHGARSGKLTQEVTHASQRHRSRGRSRHRGIELVIAAGRRRYLCQEFRLQRRRWSPHSDHERDEVRR